MRGSDRCKHHSEHEARTKAQAAADTIKVSPLPELVSLDVTDPLILKRFRKGIMAHVARQTLGVQEARALLDVALSIYESERRERPPTAMSTLTAALRRAMKSEATPTGEGGDSQPSDEAKDVKARIATDPK
jgi:hypothetical protein